jgi:hypothetical protein
MTYETIFLQIAADYAKFHALSPMHKVVYARAFGVEGGFDKWLDKMEAEARAKAASARARLLAEGGAVPSAVQRFAPNPPVTAPGTNAPSAGGIRTNAAAPGAVGGAGKGEARDVDN